MKINEEIIRFINQNRLSTTEVADALGKTGFLPNTYPVNYGKHTAGLIRHIEVNEPNNSSVHKAIEFLREGEILLVTSNSKDAPRVSLIGELMIKSAILYKSASAVITTCNVRDTARIKKENYPVWALGSSPIGASNNPAEEIIYGDHNDSIAVADDAGVVVIPRTHIDELMLNRLQLIEDQEDLWSFCINTLKWSTYKTIVEKAYLSDSSEIPEHLRNKIELFKDTFSKITHTLD